MARNANSDKKLIKSEVPIVLGDPHNYSRAMISEVLRNLGYQRIYTACNGEEIIEAANVWHPRVIILENLLPDMKGTELVSRIRRSNIVSDRSVPCIMLTNDPRIETVQEARMAGVDEFAAKPVSHKVIEARLDEVLLRPRPFVEAKKYVGPCRRRKRNLSYKGPLKRLSDPVNPIEDSATDEEQMHRQMLVQRADQLSQFSHNINPKSRVEVRQLYNTANEANEVAKQLRDDALELATSVLSRYIEGVGASGDLRTEVIEMQIDALRLLLGSTDRNCAERLEIARGLRKIVVQKLRETA